jgi:acyl-CoA reductase-like NAD-dependent aldehyde dehydrogenase
MNLNENSFRAWFLAANWAALGILYNTGQDCTAGSRVYVQDTVYDKFVGLLVDKAKQLVVGDGSDPKTAGGPLVRGVFVLSDSWLSIFSLPEGLQGTV